MTIGAALISVGVLRKLAAGFGADAFHLLDGLLGEMNVSGQSWNTGWSTETKNAGNNEGRD